MIKTPVTCVMKKFTKEELEEALTAIISITNKCEKAIIGLEKGTAQHTLMVRRIEAFYISKELIERELSQ